MCFNGEDYFLSPVDCEDKMVLNVVTTGFKKSLGSSPFSGNLQTGIAQHLQTASISIHVPNGMIRLRLERNLTKVTTKQLLHVEQNWKRHDVAAG